MEEKNTLFLHEEILLLALRDEDGTIVTGTMYQHAISGAILSELLINKRIEIRKFKNKKLINFIDSTPVGDPVIDECLKKISSAKRRAPLQNWVSRFAGLKNLKHRVADQLCKCGILRVDEDKVLLLFTRKVYPEVNPEPEKELIGRLREAIFTDTNYIDPRTIILISLANSANLLKMIFDKKKLKKKKKRIEQIINGEIIGKATEEAIESIKAAVVVAAVIPVIMAASVSH